MPGDELRRGFHLAIGNVVGSCVCNIALVMGVTAVVARAGVPVDPAAVRFDMPVMVAVAAALLPMVFTRFVITRAEAAAFLVYYMVYVAYLLPDAADHDALPAFSAGLLWLCHAHYRGHLGVAERARGATQARK